MARFRTHRYVLISDIEKIYRQILVNPKDSNLQRIVWRYAPHKELQHYALRTVTYGTASASFLATRCLAQIARLTQDIKSAFNRKESDLAVFVDFKGAYDTVWREKLINKIRHLNITENMFNWLKRFLKQRWISTRYNDSHSKHKQVKIGLPQGAVNLSLIHI